ncbi:hypothetical protein AB205_0106080, partial [Aquarana catesbeiana]
VHLVGYLFIHSQICLCSSLAELHVVSRCACGCCCHHGSVLERQHVEAYECSSIPEITRWRWSFELHSGRGYLWDRRHVLGFVFVPPAGPPGRQLLPQWNCYHCCWRTTDRDFACYRESVAEGDTAVTTSSADITFISTSTTPIPIAPV